MLAARAGRRVAESIRRASGRAALAADAEHLLPVLAADRAADVFADPFADADEPDARPVLVVLDDGSPEAVGRASSAAGCSPPPRSTGSGWRRSPSRRATSVARYAALLATGTYAAAYLRVGLTPHA